MPILKVIEVIKEEREKWIGWSESITISFNRILKAAREYERIKKSLPSPKRIAELEAENARLRAALECLLEIVECVGARGEGLKDNAYKRQIAAATLALKKARGDA